MHKLGMYSSLNNVAKPMVALQSLPATAPEISIPRLTVGLCLLTLLESTIQRHPSFGSTSIVHVHPFLLLQLRTHIWIFHLGLDKERADVI